MIVPLISDRESEKNLYHTLRHTRFAFHLDHLRRPGSSFGFGRCSVEGLVRQHLIAKGSGRGQGLHATKPDARKRGIRRRAVLSQVLLGRCQFSGGIDATHPETFTLHTLGHIWCIIAVLGGRLEPTYSPCHRRFRACLALSTLKAPG